MKALTSSGTSATVPLEIRVLDVNDNPPVFSQREYTAEINEMAPYGTRVVQVNATDRDSGLFGHVIYSSLVGSDAFRIDSESGVILVEKPMDLDRETTPGNYRKAYLSSGLHVVAHFTLAHLKLIAFL